MNTIEQDQMAIQKNEMKHIMFVNVSLNSKYAS
jgi:hypothetical protein